MVEKLLFLMTITLVVLAIIDFSKKLSREQILPDYVEEDRLKRIKKQFGHKTIVPIGEGSYCYSTYNSYEIAKVLKKQNFHIMRDIRDRLTETAPVIKVESEKGYSTDAYLLSEYKLRIFAKSLTNGDGDTIIDYLDRY